MGKPVLIASSPLAHSQNQTPGSRLAGDGEGNVLGYSQPTAGSLAWASGGLRYIGSQQSWERPQSIHE